MREGFASTLWDTSSSLPSARAVSMLVCSERVSSAQEAAAEVMATRAMAMSAMTMQMTAQAFARESAAAEMPSLWGAATGTGHHRDGGRLLEGEILGQRRGDVAGAAVAGGSAGASGGGAPIRDAVGAGARCARV